MALGLLEMQTCNLAQDNKKCFVSAEAELEIVVTGQRLITDIFYPQMSQICADFFESRLLGAGRPVCLRFPVASLVFSAEGAKHTSAL
ncbi:MAG: hypothetical protein ACOX9E_03635 [Lentisphaeria bacterium]|jgi:hypothetical protein